MNINRLRELSLRYSILKAILFPAIITRRAILQRIEAYQNEILNNFCDLVINDPIIKASMFEGVFSVDKRSALFQQMIRNKNYEPILVDQCLDYLEPERDIIDVGANIGFFTVLFAKKIRNNKKVLAIEPSKYVIKRLYENIELNRVKEAVIVFEGVASNCLGKMELKTIKGREEFSTLGEMAHPLISKEQYKLESVNSSTIDALVEKFSLDPGFIKIDVEGVENLVIAGAQTTLSSKRPVILSELSDFLLKKNGSSAYEVIRMIEKQEYSVVDPISPALRAGSKEFGDILCIPREKSTIQHQK